MSGDFVLVVDADLSAYRALVEGLPSDTYDVVSAATARAGFNVACALEPHVIVASLDLPDADALELASVIRGHDTRVAYTPLVVLTTSDDESTRLAVLASGADVVLSAPIDPAELVAQVNAMIAMGERIRELERGQSILPPASDGESFAVLGDPTKMSIASVLGALELEQRSGELRFSSTTSPSRLAMSIASGVIIGGTLDQASISPLEALKAALTWSGTQFGFVPRELMPAPAGAQQLGALLIAAFNETEPSDRLAHEIEASQRLFSETAASLKLTESIAGLRAAASLRFGETASGLRLEDTAAGRRFLRDTAAGLRLGSTIAGARLAESVAGLKPADTAAGIRMGTTTSGKVAPAPTLTTPTTAELTSTLTSFDQRTTPTPTQPPSERSSTRMRTTPKPDLSAEKAAMRGTLRGLEVEQVIKSSRGGS
ncbi:response regulator [Polyangium mundeleinium]|uniref:Response regulator n=1 Tax=Polyangium mundeleinium TaxID=2995306 RepID=A0ABT5F5Y1_9BACT|nr:response regulator [Polyangium mundeleinium]MDC0749509.1 response regulator [Polyangium mundeleinium]